MCRVEEKEYRQIISDELTLKAYKLGTIKVLRWNFSWLNFPYRISGYGSMLQWYLKAFHNTHRVSGKTEVSEDFRDWHAYSWESKCEDRGVTRTEVATKIKVIILHHLPDCCLKLMATRKYGERVCMSRDKIRVLALKVCKLRYMI